MDEVRKYPCRPWVFKRVGSLFGYVVTQDALVNEGVISAYAQHIAIFEMDSPDETEVFTHDQGVVVVINVCIRHLLVRVNIPVLVVDFFDGGFIEDLCRASVIFSSEATRLDLCRDLGQAGGGGRRFCAKEKKSAVSVHGQKDST